MPEYPWEEYCAHVVAELERLDTEFRALGRKYDRILIGCISVGGILLLELIIWVIKEVVKHK